MTSLARIAVVVLAALAAPAAPTPSAAQPAGAATPARYARPRIVVTPRLLQFRRRCTSWLELQHRESGTVLYPQYSCWWERQ